MSKSKTSKGPLASIGRMRTVPARLILLAAVGSAVGLGNIWRFGYMAYENGGGAFLVPYAVALLTAGIPLMILEYGLGHREKASPPLAFARIHRLCGKRYVPNRVVI